MKLLVLTVACWCVLMGSVLAQQPEPPRAQVTDARLPQVTPTPTESMWLYVQEMRRYDDPKQAVRRNAEARAGQRRARIAAAKWLGYSKQRPMVMPTPTTSFYGPQLYTLPIAPFGVTRPVLAPLGAYPMQQEMLR